MVTIDARPTTVHTSTEAKHLDYECPKTFGSKTAPVDFLELSAGPISSLEEPVTVIRSLIGAKEHEVTVNLVVERKGDDEASTKSLKHVAIPMAVAAKPGQVGKQVANPMRASCPALPLSVVASEEKGSEPSYLKPTASAASRKAAIKAKDIIPEEAEIISRASKPTVPTNKRSNKAYKHVVSKVFAPTTSFLSRITGTGPNAHRPPPPKNDVLRQSMALQVMSAPQGQRITKAIPFALSEDRGNDNTVSTDDAILTEAARNQHTARRLDKKIFDPKPLEGTHVRSVPKSPEAIYAPFNLESEKRHAAVRAEQEAAAAAALKSEQEARSFKARALDVTAIQGKGADLNGRMPEVRTPPTRVAAPALRIWERMSRAKDSAAARRARLPAAERAALEAHEEELAAEAAWAAAQAARAKKERAESARLEKMDVSELRKSQAFQARPMPAFDSSPVFSPTKANKVTQSQEFNFRTASRPAASVAAAAAIMDLQASAAGSDGTFGKSLRASTSGKSVRRSKKAAAGTSPSRCQAGPVAASMELMAGELSSALAGVPN